MEPLGNYVASGFAWFLHLISLYKSIKNEKGRLVGVKVGYRDQG